MLARSALRSARSVPAATHARAFSSGEFFPGIPKIQVRAQRQPSTFCSAAEVPLGRPTAYRFSCGAVLTRAPPLRAQYDPSSKPSDMTFKYYNADEVRAPPAVGSRPTWALSQSWTRTGGACR